MLVHMLVFVVIFTAGAEAFGGGGMLTGRERDAWGHEGYSVIVAHVVRVKTLPGVRSDEGTHEVRLEPLATLAGKFDPTQDPDLLTVMSVDRGSRTSSTDSVPPVDALVLAVIEPGFLAGDPKRPCIWITSMFCRFMPRESALVVIDGLGDKRITETVARIRDARKHRDD